MKIEIEYQDSHGRWKHLQTVNNEANAFQIAKKRSSSKGVRHRLIDESGHLLDLVDP